MTVPTPAGVAVDRSWRWPRLTDAAPAERLATIRVLVGGFAVVYLVARSAHLLSVARLADRDFAPVGPLSLLESPLPVPLFAALVFGAIVSGLAFTAGWRYRWTAPLFAVLFLLVTTYRNSWGQIFHTENLLTIHILVLAVAPAATVWSIDGRDRTSPHPDGEFGWPIRTMSLVTVAAYLVAGWAKIRTGGLDWITGDALIHQVAFDNVRKAALGDLHSPFADVFIEHRWIARPASAIALLVELAAPIALLSRRAGRWWSCVAWLFHVGVLALMWIVFPYQLSGIAFASFFRVERLADRLSRLRRPKGPA